MKTSLKYPVSLGTSLSHQYRAPVPLMARYWSPKPVMCATKDDDETVCPSAYSVVGTQRQ